MPVDTGVWRIDEGLRRITPRPLDLEERLEGILAGDISIASPNWLVIGRQVRTDFGKVLDLLAIDGAGTLIVLELKRDRTYRDVVAQVLDYWAWVRGLDDVQIVKIHEDYLARYHPERAGQSFDAAFKERFGVAALPDELNAQHELVIVASELDPSTERVVAYLAEHYGVQINAVFFQVFKDGAAEYLVRAWLREPATIEAAAEPRKAVGGAGWNGEYYVSFGEDPSGRSWEEARRYGFVSGGGGTWYSRTLDLLEPGARCWVKVPGHGYVGVGVVTGSRQPIDDFLVEEGGKRVPLLSVKGTRMTGCRTYAADGELAEYLVPVRWLAAVPLTEAVQERGFFGNQNTVAKPRTEKWAHTVERLRTVFGVSI